MAKDITALIRAEEAVISASEKRLKKLRAIAKELAELSQGSTAAAPKKRGRKKGSTTKTTKTTKKAKRGAPRGKRTGPTLAEEILKVVGGGGSLTSGDIVREVIDVRAGTKPPSVYTTLNKLKKDGRLYQEGGFWYSNP